MGRVLTNKRTGNRFPAIFGSPGFLSGKEICARCGVSAIEHTQDNPITNHPFVMPSATHEYFEGPLGEIAVPRKTRRCKGCGMEFIYTIEEMARHRKHGEVERI